MRGKVKRYDRGSEKREGKNGGLKESRQLEEERDKGKRTEIEIEKKKESERETEEKRECERERGKRRVREI